MGKQQWMYEEQWGLLNTQLIGAAGKTGLATESIPAPKHSPS